MSKVTSLMLLLVDSFLDCTFSTFEHWKTLARVYYLLLDIANLDRASLFAFETRSRAVVALVSEAHGGLRR